MKRETFDPVRAGGTKVDADTEALAHEVIGAAIEVHKTLGPGFPELVYEQALAHELNLRKIQVSCQSPVLVKYKDVMVGEGRIDMLVGGRLVVELKAVETFAEVHAAQVVAYLKAINQPLGLLINFNVPVLRQGIKRIIH